MKIHISNRYAVIPNGILNDWRLSLKAKGLWVYIQGKPDNWDFSSERIAEQNLEGRDAVRSGLRELERFWYLERIKVQNTGGFWEYEYVLKEEGNNLNLPIPVVKAENPETDNPSLDNPATDNPSINKERESNKDLVKKTDTERETTPKEQNRAFFNEWEKGDKERILFFLFSIVPGDEHFEIVRREVDKFWNFWTERNATGTKMKWELQKTFELKRRLRTWFGNVRGFEGGVGGARGSENLNTLPIG